MASTTASAERVGSQSVGSGALGRILLYGVLILFSLFFLLPLLWMLVTALKPQAEWLSPSWVPTNPTTSNFQQILNNPSAPVLRWFANSMLIATAFTLLTLALDAAAAYAYARMEFPGRSALFGLLLATLVMPGIIFLVPNYLTVARLGGLNNYWGVIAPGLAGVFGVFFLRQFFQGIPKELEEAALIDGAGVWTTFYKVVLPLAKPAMATLGIITFLASWNDFLWPLLVMQQPDKLTLPVGLATFQGAYVFEYGPLMAGAVIAAVPVLILYLILQKYIVASVAMTGIKG
ncbi:MAG: carbohydrate ABC transporter permease [Chloroflexota bacterium]|nr:carbohydrate ABC transporter permease [Chloroflexota bacterium]